MTMRMLVDAAHSEQVRLVIADDDKIHDFEVESQAKTQTKGNIYVAEVSRVEPSLQAAFVDYGGGRNGFLAFGELHPSYFDVSDEEKKELLAEIEAVAAARRQAEEEQDSHKGRGRRPRKAAPNSDGDLSAEELAEDEAAAAKAAAMAEAEQGPTEDEAPKFERKTPIHRRYRIENVLKEGQKIVVQMVKEERGTKGAAMTTYISLPGRYIVLMPNTPSAGGISRKITNASERGDLQKTVDALKVPASSGLIVRTASVGQPADEIKRDYKNLTALWDKIQQEADKTKGPDCIHEDGSLVVRALRDILRDDVEEILISGRRTYRQAKDFAKALMPDIAKKIKEYKDSNPIYIEYDVESELNELYRTRVSLPSGGYIIINPTEALVAVDVNSGRNTQERNLEETALRTNIEAAEEVARQLRLRDLSGLIVVDFIDQEDRRNSRQIEKAMRKALKRDRARVQCSGLSQFGLLEISRQRLRPSIVEATLERCPHCHGAGWVNSLASSALIILRSLEQEHIRASADRIVLTTNTELAIYILNYKKDLLKELESKYKFQILVRGDDSVIAPDYRLELMLMKSDGSFQSKTLNVQMREDPEEAPEAKTARSRRAAKRSQKRKPAAKTKDTSAKEAKSDKSEKGDSPQKADNKAADKAEKPAKKAPKRASKTADEKPAKETEQKPEAKKDAEPKANNKTEKAAAKPVPSKPAGRRPRRARPVVKPDAESTSAEKKPAAKKTSAKSSPVQVEQIAPDDDKKGVFQRWWSKA